MAEYEKVKQTIVSSFDEYLKGLASEQILRNPEDHKQFHQTINELEDFLDQENDKYCQPITEEERRKKREGDIEEWILKFSFIHREHFGHAPKFIDNAVSLLNKDYWIIIDEYIRPFLDKSEGKEHRINFFKIISCTELTIMYRLPVDHEDLDQQIFLNAIFAIMTGKHLLSVYNKCGPVSFSNTIAEEEHFKWLQMVYTDPSFPYFLNAHTWMYFNTILHLQKILAMI